jgi:hypothetical protein
MTSYDTEHNRPQPGPADAAAEGAALAPAVATVHPRESAERAGEFDPMTWEVPLVCKDCDKPFKVPYRHFQTGVVFHCPHCRGSFVPNMEIYRTVRDTFEFFYARRKREREEFARKGGDEVLIGRRQVQELEEFHKLLERLAHEMRPAGKLVRRRGIGAMFT